MNEVGERGQAETSFIHDEPAEFSELVGALEAHHCSRLKSPARELCLEAYKATPRGFAILVHRALEKARTNPLGLLIAMVRNEDHLAGL